MANGFTGRLRAFLGLDTSDFDKNLKRSGQNVQGFGQNIQSSLSGAIASASGFGRTFAAGLAGGVVASAFAGFGTNIRETIRGVAAIGDEAKRAGVPLQAFQEWSFVADQNRIEVDSLIDGFKELSLRADEFVVTGAGPASEAFGRLGYTAGDLRKKLKDPSELLLEVLGRMEDLDGAAQIRISDEIFGGSAGERFVELLGQGEGKIRDTIRQFRELGIAFDQDAIVKAVELDQAFGRVSMTIGNLYRESVVQLADDIANMPVISFGETELHLKDLIALMGQLGDELADHDLDPDIAVTLGAVSDMAAIAVKDMRDLATAAGDVEGASQMSALADEIERLIASYAEGEIDAEKFSSRISELQDKAVDAASGLADVDAVQFETVMWGLEKIGALLASIASLGREASAALPGDAPGNGEMFGPPEPPPSELAPESSIRPRRPGVDTYGDWVAARDEARKPKGGSGKDKVDDYTAATTAIREEIAALEAEAAAFLLVTSSNREYGDAVEYARRRAELMYAAQKAGKEISPQLQEEIDQLAQKYVTVGMSAEDAADKISQIEENGRRGASALTDIFMGILEGSMNAQDAIASLLMEMAKIQSQKLLLSLAGGDGVLGWIGGALTMGSNAGGTKNWRGGLTRVNELGGEIMNLPRGTQIIPHDISKRMADGAGGGGTIVQVINNTGQPVREERSRGPDGREIIRTVVGEEWARGSFDQSAKSRNGLSTHKRIR